MLGLCSTTEYHASRQILLTQPDFKSEKQQKWLAGPPDVEEDARGKDARPHSPSKSFSTSSHFRTYLRRILRGVLLPPNYTLRTLVNMVAFSRIIVATALAIPFAVGAPVTTSDKRIDYRPGIPGAYKAGVESEGLVNVLDNVLKHSDRKSELLGHAQEMEVQDAVDLLEERPEWLKEEGASDKKHAKREEFYHNFSEWPEEWQKDAIKQFDEQYEKDMTKLDHPRMSYDDWFHALSDDFWVEGDLYALIYPTSSLSQVASFNNVMQKVECRLHEAGAILKAPRGCPEYL